MNHVTIGLSEIRPEAESKVRGEGVYTMHFEVPGAAHALVLRSPHPHARIRHIDASRAERLPGVFGVLTRDDFIGNDRFTPTYGPVYYDQPVVALDKVRYVGDRVAAVAATDIDTAEEALSLIDVEYEEIPAATDLEAALAEGAPLIHGILEPPSQGFADLKTIRPIPGTNICNQYRLRYGNVDKGFAESDHVFEHEFTTPTTQHVAFEPYNAVAKVERGNRVTIWSSTQNPFLARNSVARVFRTQVGNVRIIIPGYLGGGYGSKTYARIEPVTACLAWKSGRPVRLTLSREECFLECVKHASLVKIKTGVGRDGRFRARKTEIYLDTGAYADIGPRVAKNCGYVSCGPFKMPNAWVDSHCVLTNKPSSGPFRGFGVAQVSWAYAQQNDIIARALGIESREFLDRNLIEPGDEFITTSIMKEIDFKENLRRATEAIGWDKPPEPAAEAHVKVGRGVAVAIKSTVTPTTSSAFITVNNDGSVSVLCSTVDMGQGSDAVMAQIAAETLGTTFDSVKIVHPDTDVTPYDQMTNSSRSTFHVGSAVSMAAIDAKKQICDLAADLLEAAPEDLEIREGRVFPKTDPDRGISIQDVIQGYFGMDGGNILGRGVLKTKGGKLDKETGLALEELTTVYWFPAAGAAEVEVDTETGVVKLRKFVNAVDVGKALNPKSCREQVSGSATMALGQTFFESLNFDNGQPLNPHFVDYILPSFEEIPGEMQDILVETPVKDGPFGARGTGETSITPPSPAVANAVFDAVGVRIHDLPITPEKVLRALRDKEAREASS